MKTFIISIVALGVLSSCSQGSNPGSTSDLQAVNIVGGRRSSDNFQKQNGIVALVINTASGQGLCSGTLIDRKIVLTAAHCLDSSSEPIQSVAVVFAKDLSKATREQVRFGVKGLVHEGFQAASLSNGPGSWNDIALLKLDQEAPQDFALAQLPSADTPINAGMKVTEAGFGKTQAARNASGDTSGVLKQVSNINIDELSADSKELHLSENGRGSCNGDSGGPAFLKVAGRNIQVGIDSRGTEDDNCLGTGIYTNIAAHLSWISDKKASLLSAQ